MATLTGNKVKDSYQSLLKLSTGGSTSTIKTIEDGLGVGTALKLSTTAVEVNTLKITETPTTSSSELTVLVYDDATKEVKSREISASAFNTDGTYEETFIGYSLADQLLEGAQSAAVVLATPDNTDEQSSYHLGNAPAKLFLEDPGTSYIQNISGSQQVVFIDMSAAVVSANANKDITFTLSRWDGTSWSTIQSFRYETVSSVPEGVSFWGMAILEDDERLRVDIYSVAGGVTLKAGSLFKYVVKNSGNII